MLKRTTLRQHLPNLYVCSSFLKASLLLLACVLSSCSDLNNIDLSTLTELGIGALDSPVSAPPNVSAPGASPFAARAEYDAKCGACHGPDGKGTAFYPQSIAPGSCTQLNCADVNALVDYIQRTMPSAGMCMGDCASSTANIVATFPVGANPAGGDVQFRSQCVRCHGAEGEGIPSLGTVEIGQDVCVSVDCADTVALTTYIETSMPPDLPRLCVSDCAVETALFVSTIEPAPLPDIIEQVPVAPPADQAEVVVQNTPFTNEELMAMEGVVITAVVTANDTTFFSDVGNTAITTVASISDPNSSPTGAKMTGNDLLMVKAGQKLNICNHASSSGRFRAHSSNRAGFAHWGRAQQLDPGQCNMGQNFPEVILPDAVGRNAGGMYNHNQGENESTVFISVVQ